MHLPLSLPSTHKFYTTSTLLAENSTCIPWAIVRAWDNYQTCLGFCNRHTSIKVICIECQQRRVTPWQPKCIDSSPLSLPYHLHLSLHHLTITCWDILFKESIWMTNFNKSRLVVNEVLIQYARVHFSMRMLWSGIYSLPTLLFACSVCLSLHPHTTLHPHILPSSITSRLQTHVSHTLAYHTTTLTNTSPQTPITKQSKLHDSTIL